GQIRSTGSGKTVFGFSVADTPRRQNDQGQWEDAGPTTWYDVSAWGDEGADLAERMADFRGQLTVNGRVTGVRTYEVQGETRAEVQVTADAVALHPKRTERQQPTAPQSSWGGG